MAGPHELKSFLELCRTLNVNRAAERLGVSQPGLSHLMKRLETELGVKLFDRSKQGLSLTRPGARLRASAERLVADWDGLVREVRNEDLEVSGRFRLGCHVAVASYALVPLVVKLQKDLPRVELELQHGLSRHMTEGVITRALDLALAINPPRHPDLVIRELIQDEVTIWSLSRRAGAAPPDMLVYDPEMLQAQSVLKQIEKRGLVFRKHLRTPSLELAAQIAATGSAAAILPGRVARGIVRHVKLEPVDAGIKPYMDRLALVYRAGFQKSAGGRALIAAVCGLRL
jgi:DNA-binding transcriptional LysR family regulator